MALYEPLFLMSCWTVPGKKMTLDFCEMCFECGFSVFFSHFFSFLRDDFKRRLLQQNYKSKRHLNSNFENDEIHISSMGWKRVLDIYHYSWNYMHYKNREICMRIKECSRKYMAVYTYTFWIVPYIIDPIYF